MTTIDPKSDTLCSAELAEFITVSEAAGMLRVHRDTLLRAIASGRVRSIRLSPNGRHRIPKADVLRLLEIGAVAG